MGSRLLYYLVILPISILPYPLLYGFSDIVYLILFRLVGYRKSVVRTNVERSFPDMTVERRNEVVQKFYHHLCDLVLETIKGFTISKRQLRKRFKMRNPELLEHYFEEGRSVVFVGGHYNNWEILALGVGFDIQHLPIGIYKPLNNKFFNDRLLKTRQRFRLGMVPIKDVKEMFKKGFDEPSGIIFGMDQSPSNPARSHWMEFLNQDTAVSYGAEKYAREYNMPVLYCTIHKMRRGYYEGQLRPVTDDPSKNAKGEIIEKSTRILEADILNIPQYWLWSHKRWKAKRPQHHLVSD